MKKIKLLIALFATIALSSAVYATEVATTANMEAYAHPTLFGSQVQETVDGKNAVYTIGEKVLKDEEALTVKGKDSVMIDSWVNNVLSILKSNSKGVFNPKMPILRSEMAVILAEGLSIKQVKPKYQYTDIDSKYWAKSWIDKVLSEGVMIGYPDKKFRPDQPITKAEVFATLAQLMNIPIDRSLIIPELKGYQMQNIPRWAITPTKEILASKLLNEVPNPELAAKSKYLSKEQVAYLVGALRQSYTFNSKFANSKYTPTFLKIEMMERVDARHSNIGDTFYASLKTCATILGKKFDEGALIKGEVVEISRPGIKNPGYIKVKFLSVKNKNCTVEFPNNITDVKAFDINNLNVAARLFATPLSTSGRILGVAGRTAATGMNVIANNTERYSDDWSNAVANTMSLESKSGLRSIGKSFVTLGNGLYDVSKVVVSGTFGVVYELGDEIKYLILPCKTNGSSLNPGDELIIIY